MPGRPLMTCAVRDERRRAPSARRPRRGTGQHLRSLQQLPASLVTGTSRAVRRRPGRVSHSRASAASCADAVRARCHLSLHLRHAVLLPCHPRAGAPAPVARRRRRSAPSGRRPPPAAVSRPGAAGSASDGRVAPPSRRRSPAGLGPGRGAGPPRAGRTGARPGQPDRPPSRCRQPGRPARRAGRRGGGWPTYCTKRPNCSDQKYGTGSYTAGRLAEQRRGGHLGGPERVVPVLDAAAAARTAPTGRRRSRRPRRRRARTCARPLVGQ